MTILIVNKKLVVAAVLTTCLGASGCTVVREPHLYPDNALAAKTGVLQGRFVGHGNLHGTMEVTMPDGELLQGEYSVVAGGAVTVGNTFASVSGGRGSLTGTGTGVGLAMAAGGQGQASLYGNRGTIVHCEFANNNITGHGYGTCETSSGARYRMEY
jgi:hypothetical protein